MADSTDQMKLSSFVNSIINAKIKAIINSMVNVATSLKDHTTTLTKLRSFQNRFARGNNAYGSWELRPGVIEMWGRRSRTGGEGIGPTSIVFPLVLPHAGYSLYAMPLINGSDVNRDVWVQIIDQTRSPNAVSIQYQSSNSAGQTLDGFDWRLICQVPFDYAAVENTGTPASGTGDASIVSQVTVANSRTDV